MILLFPIMTSNKIEYLFFQVKGGDDDNDFKYKGIIE